MWYSDNWKDYELLDTSDGERLERWGNLILIRPDPQIIWKGVAKHPAWKKADGICRNLGKFNMEILVLFYARWALSIRDFSPSRQQTGIGSRD